MAFESFCKLKGHLVVKVKNHTFLTSYSSITTHQTMEVFEV